MSDPIQLKLFAGQSVHDASGEMAQRITDLVFEYSDKVPLVLALGVLEVVKATLLQNQLDEAP